MRKLPKKASQTVQPRSSDVLRNFWKLNPSRTLLGCRRGSFDLSFASIKVVVSAQFLIISKNSKLPIFGVKFYVRFSEKKLRHVNFCETLSKLYFVHFLSKFCIVTGQFKTSLHACQS